jgi:hypothetical protein
MRTTLLILVLFVLAALAEVTTVLPSTEVQTRSFSRVVLLEEKAETSASVSVGDLNGDWID